jgi:hypothetical protein
MEPAKSGKAEILRFRSDASTTEGLWATILT